MRTYSLFTYNTRSTVPTLWFEVVADETRARALAERAFAESPDQERVEVREDDRLVFALDRNHRSSTPE
jgi:hypothetical protein